MDGNTDYSGVRSSNNHIVQLQKLTAQEFGALPAPGEGHLILPNWEDGNWTNYMENAKTGPMPIEKAHSKIFLCLFCSQKPVSDNDNECLVVSTVMFGLLLARFRIVDYVTSI